MKLIDDFEIDNILSEKRKKAIRKWMKQDVIPALNKDKGIAYVWSLDEENNLFFKDLIKGLRNEKSNT